MRGLAAENDQLPKVADFYHGKSVFITGAAGFIGSVLLETLLRCCPGIKAIYILLRPKKNVRPEDRKEQIFNKRLFGRLKEENEKLLENVHVISGDISLLNLGMCPKDVRLLIEEVSIVFHCAASVSFIKSLRFALLTNVSSVNSVIDLCRKMKKFESLVYTSTAYSNCNHTNVTLEEQVYRLPFRADKFIDALNLEDDKTLQELFSQCKPDWPNTYTFSKCLAENFIMDTASDLPVAIIRPSIVLSTWKHPIPGYDEGSSFAKATLLGFLKGFLKVLNVNSNCKMNYVPADIVANTHILAACRVATKRCDSPMIVHSTGTEKFQVTLREFSKIGTKLALKCPHIKSFSEPTDCLLVRNRYLYYAIAAYYHYLPAMILDVILKILRNECRFCSSYLLFDKKLTYTKLFVFFTFEFERKNLEHLDKLIHTEDRKDLSLDLGDATLMELLLKLPEICPNGKSPSEEEERLSYWRHVIMNCIQWTFVIIFSLLMYQIFSFMIL